MRRGGADDRPGQGKRLDPVGGQRPSLRKPSGRNNKPTPRWLRSFATSDLSLATLYATAVKDGRIVSTTAMETPNTADIAAILDTLSAEHKKAIEGRLIAMSQAAYDASQKIAPLEEQVSAACLSNIFDFLCTATPLAA